MASDLLDNDPLWYKDAIIYELHVRAFCDSNADGIGDFKGLTQKLDYLQDLGITAIWLLPFCSSPLHFGLHQHSSQLWYPSRFSSLRS
jgi:maltose alpha-D-glucosyltransferase/alpha-amylase